MNGATLTELFSYGERERGEREREREREREG